MLTNSPPWATNLETESQYMILYIKKTKLIIPECNAQQ